MVRKAVGAVVLDKYGKYLLVHKVKVGKGHNKSKIDGEWDFVKGGIEESDINEKEAIIRELFEETGTSSYIIEREIPQKISFSFPLEMQKKIGFSAQETTMFLVLFTGDSNELTPSDDEIDKIGFFDFADVLELLAHIESINFIKNFAKR